MKRTALAPVVVPFLFLLGRAAGGGSTAFDTIVSGRTLELVWSYAGPNFFSTNISGAQRLPNGNTLITEGAGGRLFEVTAEGDIVWEYVHPVFSGARRSNGVYRAYRIPYEWIPQLPVPDEVAVTPPSLVDFRVP